MGQTIVDVEKSTFQAIHLLFDKGRWLAAATILICSVVAPFLKLAVLLVCAYLSWGQETTRPGVDIAISSVRRISKWATVDAFTASVFVAFFCDNAMLNVGLHKGFFCFIGYCIFSVVGALLLEKQNAEDPEELRSLVVGNSSPRRSVLPAIAGSLVLLVFLLAFALIPVFNVECSLLFLQEHLSFVDIVRRLGGHGSQVAALALVALAALLPAADFVWATLEATQSGSRAIGEWLQDFAMLDVFALSLLVVTNAASGVHASLSVTLLPGGWLLCFCALAWSVYSVTLRSQSQRHATLPSKDKMFATPSCDTIENEKVA